MIRPVHLRMARAALGWSVKELASKANVHANTVARYEAGFQAMSGTVESIEAVLLNEGIVFLDEDAALGLGVRLRKQLVLGLPENRVHANRVKAKSTRKK